MSIISITISDKSHRCTALVHGPHELTTHHFLMISTRDEVSSLRIENRSQT